MYIFKADHVLLLNSPRMDCQGTFHNACYAHGHRIYALDQAKGTQNQPFQTSQEKLNK